VSPRAAEEKGGSDLVKVYVILFALFSAGLGWFVWKGNKDRAAYESARAVAEQWFTSKPEARQKDGTPTTIYDLGTDILRYLETYQAAQLKSGEGVELPLTQIETRARAAGLELGASGGVSRVENARSKYVEYASGFTMKGEVPNLENFVKFLYNLEATSTSIRVLELSWNLAPEAKNPVPPGNAVNQPNFKLGVRRPLTAPGQQ
jgi:hypothetical protein